MNRDYENGQRDNVVFFTGTEVEHTPAKGMDTLFIVGVHSVEIIEKHLALYPDITHIFFGANHSFQPDDDYQLWDDMISYFLDDGFLCSLDIPFAAAAEFNAMAVSIFNHDKFIPQIRIPMPHIKLWNHNTMIKLDDADFNYSNPGVWSHRLHKLLDRQCFTSWTDYSLDKVIK